MYIIISIYTYIYIYIYNERFASLNFKFACCSTKRSFSMESSKIRRLQKPLNVANTCSLARLPSASSQLVAKGYAFGFSKLESSCEVKIILRWSITKAEKNRNGMTFLQFSWISHLSEKTKSTNLLRPGFGWATPAPLTLVFMKKNPSVWIFKTGTTLRMFEQTTIQNLGNHRGRSVTSLQTVLCLSPYVSNIPISDWQQCGCHVNLPSPITTLLPQEDN